MLIIMIKLLRSRIAFGNVKLTVRLSGSFIGAIDVRNVTARRCARVAQHDRQYPVLYWPRCSPPISGGWVACSSSIA